MCVCVSRVTPATALCSLEQAYEREVKETHKMEDEVRRQQQLQDRLYVQEEELKMKEQEEEERR